MLKFVEYKVTFSEFPDEISLCINLSNCPFKCKGCHSTYLREDIGNKLDWETLKSLIKENAGITCVGFMGGDTDINSLNKLWENIKKEYPNLKVGWYSGNKTFNTESNLEVLNYIKIGPYIPQLGPLNNPNTNQQMFEVVRLENGKYDLLNITYKFWK